MPIQDARQRNAQQDSCGHDQGKDDSSKVFDSVENEQLSNGTANAKHEEMPMDF
jgi:hypothetical protein